jgi:hypothetical protein
MAKNVLVYLEPCIFRDDPNLLTGHFESLVGPLLRALSHESRFAFLGFCSNIYLCLEALNSARSLPAAPRAVKIYPLYTGDLLAPFGHSIEAYARDVFGTCAPQAEDPQLLDRLASIIRDARPDVVITTSQNRYLNSLSQSLGFVLISAEHGPLPRLPFPGNRFIAVDGHMSDGPLASLERLRPELEGLEGADDVAAIRQFETQYQQAVSAHPQAQAVGELLQALKRQGSVSMLALQPEQWLTWEGALGQRRSATSIILETLATLRTDKLIVTHHAQRYGQVNPASMREIWLSDPRLELLPEELAVGLSEVLLPLVDELVTVSSNLAMSAFLLGVPLRSLGQSYARTLERLAASAEAPDDLALRGRVLRYLVSQVSVDDATFSDPARLRSRIDHLAFRNERSVSSSQPWRQVGATETPAPTEDAHSLGVDLRTMDLPDIHAQMVQRLSGGAAPATLLRLFGRHALGHLVIPSAVGAEFGVARGLFSESLLRAGRFTKLYSVDKWNDHHDDAEFAQVRDRLAHFREQSQIIRETFDEALDRIADESLDFVYVDGYAHTGHDADVLRRCLVKLKPGAVVAVHDFDRFCWPINHRRLNELLGGSSFKDQRVIPAVLTSNSEDIFPGLVATYIGPAPQAPGYSS